MSPVIASATHDDRDEPVRVAVHRRESLDDPLPGLAGLAHRPAQHVEDRKPAYREREHDPAPEEDRHAERAPRLPFRLDEHVGFAPAHRRDLRRAGADLRPHRLIVERLGDLLLLLRCARRPLPSD